MPQISVIVPVYKVEDCLNRCVDSILKQSFSDFELILIDDGSPDQCGAICDEYAKKDNRIVVIHQNNGGLSAARNAGIDWAFANSQSEWLTFIDSDDWVHPEYLERLLNAAITQNVSISVCGYVSTEGAEPEIMPDELNVTEWETESFYVKQNVNATVAWGKLYRRECFRAVRYPLGKIHEDEFLTYQILFQFPTLAVIPAPLYCYYVNPNGIMLSGRGGFREDSYRAIEEQIKYFRDKHFGEACRSRVRCYLLRIFDEIQQLSKDSGMKEVVGILKRKKRRHFPSYARLLDPNDGMDVWVLTKIYPKKMEIYWFLRAVGRKFRILGKQ